METGLRNFISIFSQTNFGDLFHNDADPLTGDVYNSLYRIVFLDIYVNVLGFVKDEYTKKLITQKRLEAAYEKI